MTPKIEAGDLIEHEAQPGRRYEVLVLVDLAGRPHAIARPIPPGSGPEVPLPINKLKILSKGGIQ